MGRGWFRQDLDTSPTSSHSMTTVSDALACLRPLTDAGTGKSLLDLEWIRNPRLQASRAVVELALPDSPAGEALQGLAQQLRQRLTTPC